jgi:hypothetical protein
VDVAGLTTRLDEVSGPSTLQSMIFEPASLTLHLTYGKGHATGLPWHTVPLGELFTAPREPR